MVVVPGVVVVVVPGVVVDVAVGVVVVVGCGSVAGPAGLMMTVGVAWADPTAFVAAINTEAGRTESGAGVPEIVAVAASKVSPSGRGVPGVEGHRRCRCARDAEGEVIRRIDRADGGVPVIEAGIPASLSGRRGPVALGGVGGH